MSNMIQDQNHSLSFYEMNAGWLSYLTGTSLGIIFSFLFHSWILLFLTAVISGFFTSKHKLGIKYGSLSVFTTYTIFVSYNIVVKQFITISDIYLGITGFEGMIFYLWFILDLVMLLIGATGGYFGSALHNLINWKEWV